MYGLGPLKQCNSGLKFHMRYGWIPTCSCVCRGLMMASSTGVLPNVLKDSEFKELILNLKTPAVLICDT